jgi:acetyl-CoA synthetase
MNAQPQGIPRLSRGIGIAEASCDRWADGTGRLAILHRRADGSQERVTFDALRSTSARLAEVLRGYGVKRGDRVATLLRPGPDAVVSLLAVLRAGAIAVPLGHALRHAALAYRLRDCGAVALITDDGGLSDMEGIAPGLPSLRFVVSAGAPAVNALSLWTEAQRAAADAPAAAVSAEDPALILYGTDQAGRPRGVLHAHRVLAAQAAAFALLHEGLPAPGDLVWTECDWAAGATWLDTVLPALSLGVPVLAHAVPATEPGRILKALAQDGVRNAVLSPATLRRLMEAGAVPAGLRLRSLATWGGALGQDVIDWAVSALGAPLNDCLTRPEFGTLLCTSARLAPARAGRLGGAAPGRTVAILDAEGHELPAGRCGEIALRQPDPGLFLGYWKGAEGPRPGDQGPWVRTGETGFVDAEGCVSTVPLPVAASRHAEVETFLLAHPAVARATVIGPGGLPFGPESTAIVVPRQGTVPGPDLADELRGFLRARLSSEVCPRRVAFALDLPPPGLGLMPAALGKAVGLGGGPAEG